MTKMLETFFFFLLIIDQLERQIRLGKKIIETSFDVNRIKKNFQKKRRQLCKTNYEMEWGENDFHVWLLHGNDFHVWLELRNEFLL